LYDMRKRPSEQRKFSLDDDQVEMTADQKEEDGEKTQVQKISRVLTPPVSRYFLHAASTTTKFFSTISVTPPFFQLNFLNLHNEIIKSQYQELTELLC
jgi:hypothetical protein